MLVEVARTGDVLPGGIKLVQAGQEKLALCNCGGRFYAVSRRCGHMNGPLDLGALDGTILTCPMHYVQFDVTTGEALGFPVPAHVEGPPPPDAWMRYLKYVGMLMEHIDVCDIKTYRVEVQGDVVSVEIGPDAAGECAGPRPAT